MRGSWGGEPNPKEQDLPVTCENDMEFNFCKVYWNIAMLIASCIVCGCFCATVAYLNDRNRNSMEVKPEVWTIWPFTARVFQPLL